MLISRMRQMSEPRRNFTLRLSEEERKRLDTDAKNNKMSPSDYLRHLIMHGGVVDTTRARDRRDFINQVSAIGNNINQYVRLANTLHETTSSNTNLIFYKMQDLESLMREVVIKWQ